MDLTKILSIGGKPGLHKMIGKSKNGFIVESLANGIKMAAFPSQQISSLEEISIYTTIEDMPLKEVFKRIFEMQNGEKGPEHKADSSVITDFFEKALPEYDRDLVKQSDMRKVIRWYNELLTAGLLKFEDNEEQTEGDSEESENG